MLTRCARALLVLGLLVLVACGGVGGQDALDVAPSSFGTAPAVQAAMQANTAVSPALVTADNSVGLELLQRLEQNGSTNLAIAPTSIALALQVVDNAAAGSTQQAMVQTLQVQSFSTPALNQGNAALQASLIDPDPQVQLTIANGLWVKGSVASSFTQVDQQYYGAQVSNVSAGPASLNQWVSTATGGLIPQLASPNANWSQLVALVVNVIYFKGEWASPFDPSQTSAAPFMRADGSQVTCQMMHQTGVFPYLQTSTFQLVSLPYGSTNRMSMLVLLPQPGVTLDSVVASVSAAQIDAWVGQLSDAETDLALPRFSTRYQTSLVNALTTLGMGIAFGGEASFPGFGGGVYLSDVQHATVVDVDESGTEAAAATAVSAVSMGANQTATVTVDRPFLYVIRDDKTGALLFVGLMFDPTAG